MVVPNERIEREVAVLGDLPREELVARWIKAYGCPPPKGVKRSLLERAAAWHLQARHLGGLSATARKAIRDAVKHGSLRANTSDRPADSKNARTGNRPIVNPPAPRSGTRLVRQWNGRTHVVDVTDDGFVFDDKTYRSLSAVAKRITGAHWSGRRFFGL